MYSLVTLTSILKKLSRPYILLVITYLITLSTAENEFFDSMKYCEVSDKIQYWLSVQGIPLTCLTKRVYKIGLYHQARKYYCFICPSFRLYNLRDFYDCSYFPQVLLIID